MCSAWKCKFYPPSFRREPAELHAAGILRYSYHCSTGVTLWLLDEERCLHFQHSHCPLWVFFFYYKHCPHSPLGVLTKIPRCSHPSCAPADCVLAEGAVLHLQQSFFRWDWASCTPLTSADVSWVAHWIHDLNFARILCFQLIKLIKLVENFSNSMP